MRVKFKENFRWKPTNSVVIPYKAGDELTVTRACGEAAIAQGKATLVVKEKTNGGSDKNEDSGGGSVQEEA